MLNIMLNIIETRKKVNRLLSDFSAMEKQYKNEKSSLKESKSYLSYVEQAQTITQHISQTIQQQAHNKIANVVSRCLETVFDDVNYGFKINFEKKRGRTEAVLILLKEGHEITDPLEADSGGVIDIASFALRLSCLMLAKPILRRIMILDEPFKNVSANYRNNVRIMLEELSKDFHIQIIMVTHDKAYQCGKVIEI